MRHTISALVENKFGVLARVAGLSRRRATMLLHRKLHPPEEPSNPTEPATGTDTE